MPSGIDQAWSTADPKKARAAGVQVVSMYVSWDASKNVTARKVKAYHKQGIAVLVNWESQPGAPVNGTSQGTVDAAEAVRQLRQLIGEVGYAPKNRPVIYFSCDRDVTPGQISGPVRSYYVAAGAKCHAAGFGVGCYGEADVVHYLAAHKITDAEWQTLAWSGGRVDPAADFYQSSINNSIGGASVDFDQVIHAGQLGAWWPPNHPLNTDEQEDELSAADVQAIRADIAALNKRIDAIPGAVWSVKLRSRVDPTQTANAAAFLTTTHLYATHAADVGNKLLTAGQKAAVDAAAVASDITSRVRAQLAQTFGSHQ